MAERDLSDDAETEQMLPCGASPDDILEQIADGYAAQLTDHQRHCVHCQAALREFGVVWAQVESSINTPVPTPDGLTRTVMQHVRRLVRDTWYTLELTEGGSIRIAARIVATLARDAARRVPGVRVALGRSTESRLSRLVERATLAHRHPHAAIGVLGRTAAVDIALAVTYGEPVQDAARAVQQAVVAELREAIGLKSIQVNVTVDDVLPAD